MSIRVVAHVTPKDGMEQQLEGILKALIAPTLAEEGCISYVLHRDLDSGHFTFIEEWTGTDALGEHFETEHIKTALVAFEEFADGLDVRKYEVIS